MKSFIKFVPVALGILTLASCSNDEFAGADKLAGKTTLTVSTEDQAITRAYASGTTSLSFTFAESDEIRVYDANMQKYDKYKYDKSSSKFICANDPQYVAAADASYAIFGEKNGIAYNGWQQEGNDGVLTAMVKIPAEIANNTYTDDKSNVSFVSVLPQWGTVTGTDPKLETNLKYLTGYAYVSLDSYPVTATTKIRVRSLKYTSAATPDQKLAVRNATKGGAVASIIDAACEENTASPLNGWFDARMEINEDATIDSLKYGKMQKVVTGPQAEYDADNTKIEYSFSANATVTGTIYLPIIPAWYEVLSFEYTTDGGTTWYVLRTLAPTEAGVPTAKVGRGTKIGKMELAGTLEGTAAMAADKNNTKEVSAALKTQVDAGKNVINVTFNGGAEALTTGGTEEMFTLYIPQLKKDTKISIESATDLTKNALLIKDATGADNSKYNVTLSFASFAENSQPIELNTTANLTLVGNYGNLPESTAKNAITVSKVTSLILGDATTAFTTTNTASAKTAVQVNAGNITAQNIAKGLSAGLLLTNAAANTVTINSADVTLADTKATVVNINAASTAATSAATININADKTDEIALTLAKGVSSINLKGGILEMSETVDGTKQFAAGSSINVTSSGSSAITGVPSFSKNVTMNYSSSFDGCVGGAEAMNSFGSTITGKNYLTADVESLTPIYTAAQLAGISTGSYALMTTITELKNWPSIGITGETTLYAQKKAIAKIDAPLFGAVGQNLNIDGLVINNATITSNVATGTGVVANSVASAAALTVKASTIGGTVTAPSYAGGLVGKVAGTATFGTVEDVPANLNKGKVTSAVTFTNNTNYGSQLWSDDAGTFGQFVGNVATGGTVTVNIDCEATGAFDRAALKFDMNRIVTDGVIKGQFVGNSTLVGYSAENSTIMYGVKVGKEAAATLTEFTSGGSTRAEVSIDEESAHNTTFTFKTGAKDAANIGKSGVINAGSPYTATVYHNSFKAYE